MKPHAEGTAKRNWEAGTASAQKKQRKAAETGEKLKNVGRSANV